MGLDRTHRALQVASLSDSRDAWMWAAMHPDADEEILINVANQKNAAKIKAEVVAHKNVTEKVLQAIGKSHSPHILLAALGNEHIPDHIKNVWTNNLRAIYNAWTGGYYMDYKIHQLPQPWKTIICNEIERQKETGYQPPGRRRLTGWLKWKKRS